MKYRILNVGGNSKAISLPSCFDGWRNDLLDIDPRGNPDVLCDARELMRLPPREYDAVYCSHNLEHYFPHEVQKVLKGFKMVLKNDGFAYIRVPDLSAVIRTVVEQNLDLEDVLYSAPAGPITVRDVFYGYHVEIERSGNDFFAHKTGFTEQSLTKVLMENGFPHVYSDTANYEVMALAFPKQPNDYQIKLLGLKL